MLIYNQFPGDDMALAGQQHDVYGKALSLIIDGARRHYVNACLMTGNSAGRWPVDAAIDHRTLQGAHDVLAAAWRWRVSPPQRGLIRGDDPQCSMADWLDWLAGEVRDWRDEPGLILSMAAIVACQNQTLGYAGELRLCEALRRRHGDVPWHPLPG